MKDIKNFLSNPAVVITTTAMGAVLCIALFLLPLPSGFMKAVISILAIVGTVIGVIDLVCKGNEQVQQQLEPYIWLVSGALCLAGGLFVLWLLALFLGLVVTYPGFFLFIGIVAAVVYFFSKKFKDKD